MLIDHSENDEEDEEDENEASASSSAPHLSDMDYLRSKMKTKSEDKPSDSSDDDGTDSDDDGNDSDDSSDESDSSDEKTSKDKSTPPKLKTKEKKQCQSLWTLKMRGLPFKLKEQQIKDFFSPIECVDIRFVNNKKGQRSGRAFVDFQNEEDLEKALKRDKDYLLGRYIELFRDDSSSRHDTRQGEEDEKPWMKKLKEKGNDDNDEDEGIGEV